jgi:hypothetical protein
MNAEWALSEIVDKLVAQFEAMDDPYLRERKNDILQVAGRLQKALSGSVGKATVAATAQTDFDILKNGASVGTMRFAIAATDATFIAASPITFAAGDVIRVNAPVTPDATLANVHFTLKGTR